MRVVVTGGSGYLGRHVRRFFDADDFSRRSDLNILDLNNIQRISDYDVVIHLAAHLDKSTQAASECFNVNASGTADVVKHMSPESVLIYASTKDVYGAHADSYTVVPETCSVDYCGQTAFEWSKLMGEMYINYYAPLRKLRCCVFRLSTVYARASEGNEFGFVTHYVESVKRSRPIRVPLGGHPIRDILHVDDFSRACQAFIESGHSHGLYNLGGGEKNSATLREIIEIIGNLIDLKPLIDEDNPLPHPTPVNYISDLTKIREQLSWEPRIGLEEGLRSLL